MQNERFAAGRLVAYRNIYIRHELSKIAKEIQKHFDHCLPFLDIVVVALYENLFHRQVRTNKQ